MEASHKVIDIAKDLEKKQAQMIVTVYHLIFYFCLSVPPIVFMASLKFDSTSMIQHFGFWMCKL